MRHLQSNRLKHIFRDESGNTMILTAASMVLLIGFAGMAIDIASASRMKRNLQTAADAAAVASALDYRYNDSVSSAQSAGQSASTDNGFTNKQNGASVTINCPPASGPNTGSGGCNGNFEAIVTAPSPANFMSLFGYSGINVSARAVAGITGAGGCIYTLGTSGTGLTVSSSNAYINAASCGIYDNADLSVTGGATIKARSVNLVGSSSTTGGSSITPAPTKISVFNDPLASLPPPTVPSPCTATISTSGTYSPGCYASINVRNGVTVTLQPGTYIVTGNFTVSGGGSISSNTATFPYGTTFYLAGASSSASFTGGSSSSNLTAPTRGVYNGVLFFQSRSDTSTFTFSGGSGTSVTGILYIPNAGLSFSGGSSGVFNVALVAKTMTITGGSTIGNYAVTNPGDALTRIGMVE